MPNVNYIGRFAPSPTGPLHLGSLIGALASFLDARANHGQWLLRMEDLDPPREIPGAAQQILDCLIAHGLNWDGDVLWQSTRHNAYQACLQALQAEQKVFYCSCIRADIRAMGGIYSGHCRQQLNPPDSDFSIRLRVDDTPIQFCDSIQGNYRQQLQRDVGDFIIVRKDKLFAYQLAVVVDDAFQNITHIVRGSDLLDSTPRQIFLQQQLGLDTPHYAHFPVITNHEGQKFSKQTHAPALSPDNAINNLLIALQFLNQALPPEQHTIETLLSWAIEHWSLASIPQRMSIEQSNFAS
jgi:glutamyl-Q tRNA(Asp) synthetase